MSAPPIQPSTDSWKGRIVAEYTVACGNAACHDAIVGPDYGRANVTDTIRAHGWRKVKPFGWLCPDCLLELNGQ